MFKILIGTLCIIAFNVQLGESYAISDDRKVNAPLETIIDELFNKVNSFQVLKEQNYTPPFKWAEKLGI